MSSRAASLGVTPPSLDQVKQWARAMLDRGVYNRNSGLNRITAIERLESVLGPDEPREVQWALDNLESIFRRWATKNNAIPNTVRTYESKARVVLRDFLNYQQDPSRVTHRNLGSRGSVPKEPPAAKPKARPTIDANPAQHRTLPLGDGRTFSFEVPGDLTTRDVRKIALHLWTLASDFDPSSSPGEPFALTGS